MSYFDSDTRFLLPMRYESLVLSHQNALKQDAASYNQSKEQFLSTPYLVEMQLGWFSLHNEIPLTAVKWYEDEVTKGNLPFGARICCNYTLIKKNGEGKEVLIPVFLQIRASQKEANPGQYVQEIKVTLDFQYHENNYRFVGFRDSAQLYIGSESVERWARYRDIQELHRDPVWVCEVSNKVQKRRVTAGVFATGSSMFYHQVKEILTDCAKGLIGSQVDDPYETLIRRITRAISSIYRSPDVTKAYPLLVMVTDAYVKQGDLARKGQSFDPKEASVLLLSLMSTLRQIDPIDIHVKALPNMT